MNNEYTAGQICYLSGATHRQVRYWSHTGLLNPTSEIPGRAGCPLIFSASDVERAKFIIGMLRKGDSLQSCRRYLQEGGTVPSIHRVV